MKSEVKENKVKGKAKVKEKKMKDKIDAGEKRRKGIGRKIKTKKSRTKACIHLALPYLYWS